MPFSKGDNYSLSPYTNFCISYYMNVSKKQRKRNIYVLLGDKLTNILIIRYKKEFKIVLFNNTNFSKILLNVRVFIELINSLKQECHI